jgi:cation transport ATPase
MNTNSRPTVMVGDRFNHAIPLEATDVGISIGNDKADSALQSTDIISLKQGLISKHQEGEVR